MRRRTGAPAAMARTIGVRGLTLLLTAALAIATATAASIAALSSVPPQPSLSPNPQAAAPPAAARPAAAPPAAPTERPAPRRREKSSSDSDVLAGSPVLVRGATLWTMGPSGRIDRGDLLVVGGKIAKIGGSIVPPAGAIVIEGEGKHVTPGIIDCHSHTAIDGDVNEATHNITAEVRIGDVIDWEDVNIYRQLAGGTTTANALHGSANSIGGQNAVLRWMWGRQAAELRFPGAPEGIKFALGENPKQ